MPDVPDRVLTAANVHTDNFSVKFGLAILLDYTFFNQNQPSILQQGVQDNAFQVRGNLTFGKTKQTFGYEMVGDAANLPQTERLLTPFFKSRDIGVKLVNTAFGERATWSVGWWNDWWITPTTWNESGQQFGGRITALPLWNERSHRYLHLAVAARYNGAGNDTLQFRGQPQTNVATFYINTGQLAANHAWHLGLEALWADGPFTVLAEYNQAWIATAQGASANGWYVLGSWMVTGGGPRPYDRKVGYTRRVPITHKHGEVELMARYGQVDFNDRDVQGGALKQWYFAANWWATRRWKVAVGYGTVNLEQDDIVGWTGLLLTRLQWIF